MRKVYISRGSRIETIDGFLEVDSYNGHIVNVTSNIIQEDGTVKAVGELRLTLSEIANEMREVDGKVRMVLWMD